jgi:hypothetical protein
MNNANTAFINALKEEVENSSIAQRNLNMETMILIKGLSNTIKKIKEIQDKLGEDAAKMRHTLTLGVH